MSFSKQINKFTDKAAGNMDKVVRMSFIEMSSKVIRTSPVGDPERWLYNHPQRGYVDFLSYREPPEGYTGGRFRANWQASVNSPKSGVVDSVDESDAITSYTIAARNKGQASYWLVNNLPYAKALEDGHSSLRPHGIVKLVTAQWKTIVRNVTKLVN